MCKGALLVIIFFSTLTFNVKSDHIDLHIDFENDNLQGPGFNIGSQPDTTIIRRDTIARYNGEKGMLITSIAKQGEYTSIYFDTAITFNQINFLSYAIFVNEYKPVLRLEIYDDSNRFFSLDYMRNSIFVWQENNNHYFYNLDLDIPHFEWTTVALNLTNDVYTALSDPNSPFDSFVPTKIGIMSIYHDLSQSDQHEGAEIYTCVDEISLNSDYYQVPTSSDPGICLDPSTTAITKVDSISSQGGVVTETITLSAESDTTPSLPVSIDFMLPVFGFVSLIILSYKERIK